MFPEAGPGFELALPKPPGVGTNTAVAAAAIPTMVAAAVRSENFAMVLRVVLGFFLDSLTDTVPSVRLFVCSSVWAKQKLYDQNEGTKNSKTIALHSKQIFSEVHITIVHTSIKKIYAVKRARVWV